MNTPIQISIRRPGKNLVAKPFRNSFSAVILLALALFCSAVSPKAVAGPNPMTGAGEDRGKNNSAAGGVEALNLHTTGQDNTAHGWHSLWANRDGNDNTANGFNA